MAGNPSLLTFLLSRAFLRARFHQPLGQGNDACHLTPFRKAIAYHLAHLLSGFIRKKSDAQAIPVSPIKIRSECSKKKFHHLLGPPVRKRRVWRAGERKSAAGPISAYELY